MPTLPTRGMLKRGGVEDIALFVERAVNQAAEAQAEFVYFDLKQHYFVIRLRWGSRIRMTWRGPSGEGREVMAYLKSVSGMDSSARRTAQAGEFPFIFRGQSVLLPTVCKPYITEEQIVFALPTVLRESERFQERSTERESTYDRA